MLQYNQKKRKLSRNIAKKMKKSLMQNFTFCAV